MNFREQEEIRKKEELKLVRSNTCTIRVRETLSIWIHKMSLKFADGMQENMRQHRIQRLHNWFSQQIDTKRMFIVFVVGRRIEGIIWGKWATWNLFIGYNEGRSKSLLPNPTALPFSQEVYPNQGHRWDPDPMLMPAGTSTNPSRHGIYPAFWECHHPVSYTHLTLPTTTRV